MEKIYSISEVADKLGLSTKTLRRWEESGKFAGNRTLGGQRRYTVTDLQILDAIKHGVITGSDDLLTIEQAAALFGVSTATIARWENEGKIHPLITSGITYYPRHKLLAKMGDLQPPTPIEVTPEPSPMTPPPAIPSPEIVQKSAPRLTLKPLSSYQVPSSPDKWLFPLNIAVTLILITLYHIFFIQPSAPESPSVKQGSVQGETTTRDPSLAVLDSILDKTGNIKPKSLTTSTLTLSPSSPSATVPGSLYFDAASQSLKMYSNGSWKDLGANTVQIDGANLQIGNATIPKNKDQVRIDNDKISKDSTITITFLSDYAPAKKYWVTTGSGYFTVHTDFPMSQNTDLKYVVITSQ